MLNNGVMFSSRNSSYVQLWSKHYSYYEGLVFDALFVNSMTHLVLSGVEWDRHYVIPFLLARHYPDLINLEVHRLAPISYGFDTALAAQHLTCGLLLPEDRAIWGPRFDTSTNAYTFVQSSPNKYLFEAMEEKVVFHMTMSQERYICSLRKNLNHPDQIKTLPSLLGHYFRLALFGQDTYDYARLKTMSDDERLKEYTSCRDMLGMKVIPERDYHGKRHQFMSPPPV